MSGRKNTHSKHKETNGKKPILFDIREDTIDTLGDIIGLCVETKTELICYSKKAMEQPDISLTEIPGLNELFVRACLQHGLLGYLDWKNETTPTQQIADIMNNIVIIVCGRKVVNQVDEMNLNKGIVHEVDEKKLAFIRERSRLKFNQIAHII